MATTNITIATHNVSNDYSVLETTGWVALFVEELDEDIELELPLFSEGVCVDIYKQVTDGFTCSVVRNNGDTTLGTLAELTDAKDCLALRVGPSDWRNLGINIAP